MPKSWSCYMNNILKKKKHTLFKRFPFAALMPGFEGFTNAEPGTDGEKSKCTQFPL